jgi:hypothetical protein
LIAARDYRHVAHAVREKLLAAAGVVKDVDGDEVDAFFRKKLFRSEAAASPGLGKEHELVGGNVHGCVESNKGGQDYYPLCHNVKRGIVVGKERSMRDVIIGA